MPQKPQAFDPNEFSAPAFDPNEFGAPASAAPDPEQMSDLERTVLGLPPKKQPSWYEDFWNTASSYVPQPVKSAWNTVWEPTTDITSRAGKAVSDYLDPTQYGRYDPRRYLAAYPEAVGNVLTGLTSPGNIALTVATGGAGAARSAVAQRALPVVAPKVAQGLTTAGRAIGGATAAHGVQSMADPNATMLQRGVGAIEAIGGGLAARAPRPKPTIADDIPDELPVPTKAAPIDPVAARDRYYELVDKGTDGTLTADELVEARQLDKVMRSGGFEAAETAAAAKIDPNFNAGIGDAELAGSVPYKAAPESPVLPPEFQPDAPMVQEEVLGGTSPITPEAPTTAQVPFMITAKMRQGLLERGFRDHEINNMKPAEAWEHLKTPAPPPIEPVARVKPPREAGEFDPTTLKGLEPAAPKPELQFADPVTGELKPASEAVAGDVPYIPETPTAQPSMPVRRAGGRMGAPNLGLSRPPKTPELAGMEGEDVLDLALKQADAEVRGQVGAQVPPAVANEVPRLPKILQGAKPRFNVGADSYFPQFADDLDKALYIIGQTKKSNADAQYLKFVMEQTGLTEVAARNAGAQVKAAIKSAVSGKEPGNISIPPIMRERLGATGGGGAKPPVKPPVTTGGTPEPPQGPKQTPQEFLEGKPQVDTGPIVPANAGVASAADVVTDTLAKRLKKAVDEAGTPNALAAEELNKLMDEAAEVLSKMPEGPEKAGLVRQVLGANKALLTSWDVSAPGRQGKAFILNKAWWTSLDDMVRAWGSKKAAETINQSILDHPSGYFTKPVSETGKVGKSFAEKVGLDLASTEEMFTAKFGQAFEKFSGVGKASRAHTAFLNKLRSDQFVSMMEGAKRAGLNPEVNLEIAKKYAQFINDATGRGSVNIGKWKLERNIGALNDVFFAPKNMAGQIRTWKNVLNPRNYSSADPVMRKQAIQSLLSVAAMGVGVGEMPRLAGAKVSSDPVSSDFRKIRIGDTRIDLFGGYQQFPVAAMKFITGQSTITAGERAGQTVDLDAGKYGQQSRGSVAERFFTNRLSPAASFVWAWMFNKEFDGKPFEYKRALFERTFPIAAKDIFELAQEDPFLATILTPTTLMGLTGTQHYSGRY